MVPDWLRDEAATSAFWSIYTEFGGYRADAGEAGSCRFDVGDGIALVLDLPGSLSLFDLSIERGDERAQLGWDDAAHWHPHVLRWSELDGFGRAIALADPSLPHPGLPLLLLARFAPISVGDDVRVITPLLDSAWATIADVDPRRVTEHIEGLDHRGDGFTWRRTDRGDVLEQTDEDRRSFALYSLRTATNDAFPFELLQAAVDASGATIRSIVAPWLEADPTIAARASRWMQRPGAATETELRGALAAAGCANPTVLDALAGDADPVRTAWVVEVLARAAPGSAVRRAVAALRTLRPRIPLELTIHGGAAAPDLWRELDEVLQAAGAGEATIGPAVMTRAADGSLVTERDSVTLTVHGDLEAAVGLIRPVLQRSGVLERMELRHRAGDRSIVPL